MTLGRWLVRSEMDLGVLQSTVLSCTLDCENYGLHVVPLSLDGTKIIAPR